MAKLTNEEIIATLKEMTILEINDLVKAIEEEFGVTAAVAAAPVPVQVGLAALTNSDILALIVPLFSTSKVYVTLSPGFVNLSA